MIVLEVLALILALFAITQGTSAIKSSRRFSDKLTLLMVEIAGIYFVVVQSIWLYNHFFDELHINNQASDFMWSMFNFLATAIFALLTKRVGRK